jgi:transcriptional regulator with XRE-family HTH domain
MARRESPLDPSEGALQSFAHDLRALRGKKGLTYRQLAVKAGYSRTTLSDAAKGEDLPTVDVVRAYVGACGGDEEDWARRWHEVNAVLSAQRVPAGHADPPSGPGDTGHYTDRALQDLAEEVRRLWVYEVLETSPMHGFPVELGCAEQPDAVWDSYGNGVPPEFGKPKPLPVEARLVDLFDTRFNRRCLVLGAAGSGKTTVLLELARDLLARAKDSRDAPVPVIFLLSRWTKRPGGLAAWIVEEMAEHYKVDAGQVRAWLVVGHLTVLLDGLDEVHPDQRVDCVQAINEFRRDSQCSLTGLVVSSRTVDYVDLDTHLELGGAVTLVPLTPEQINEHLERAGPLLSGLCAAVAHDPVLAELLANPLMLSVAILAYSGDHSDPALEHGSIEQRRHRIFDQYLTRMLTRDRTLRAASVFTAVGNRFTPQTTYRGLVWLARLMNRRGETIFYPDWFTPGWLPDGSPSGSSRPRWLMSRLASRVGWHRLATSLTYGLAGGAIIGIAYILYALLTGGMATDSTVLTVEPGYGILVGAVVCLAITTSIALTPASIDWTRARSHRTRGHLLRISFCGLVFVLTGGLLHGVIIWQVNGHRLAESLAAAATHGVVFGFSGAASVLLALGLARGLVKIDNVKSDVRRQWSWPRMEQGMFTGIVISPAVGLTNALAYALTHRFDLGLVHRLLFGLGQGLIIGLSVGLAIGLAFALVDIDTDQPAAYWRWSPRRLGTAVLAAAVYGLTYWLLFVVGAQAIVGPANGAAFGLLVGLIFWITFALGHGLVPDRTRPPPAPARALSASLRAATPPALVITSLTALTVIYTAHLTSANVTDALRLNLVTPMVLAGTLTFWFTGGGVWLAHHAARWAAAKAGLLPRDLFGFLAHADERLLLRRAGGGYQFLHRALQEHIANQDPDTEIKVRNQKS